MSIKVENAPQGVATQDVAEEAIPLPSLEEVYGFKREAAGQPLYVCLDTRDEIMAPGRADSVIEKAATVLDRQDPRETLFITNDQVTAEVILPELPEVLDKVKEALSQAALGTQPAPIVRDLPSTHGYPSYIAVELYPESNAIILRRGAPDELMDRGEPPEGWHPLPFLATNTEPYEPIGGLTVGDDGFQYDTLGIFPRFPTGEGKLSMAFIVKGAS